MYESKFQAERTANLSSGLKTLVFFATDKEGRTATVTHAIEVIPQ